MKAAFTLIELIIVIVILSFVGIFGLTQISNIYESFIVEKTSNELESDAKVALAQITARIYGGIKESIVIMDTSYHCVKPLSNAIGDDATIFAWIGGDTALIRGVWNGKFNAPAMSGFADLNLSNANSVVSSGSNLNKADEIIFELSAQKLPLETPNFVALYFGQSGATVCDSFFNQSKAMYGVKTFSNDTLILSSTPNFISQFYIPAWSAYAIEYIQSEKTLYLKYNFRPWRGESGLNAKSSVLVRNVSGFGISNDNGLIRVNLCLSSKAGGIDVEVCKESALF